MPAPGAAQARAYADGVVHLPALGGDPLQIQIHGERRALALRSRPSQLERGGGELLRSAPAELRVWTRGVIVGAPGHQRRPSMGLHGAMRCSAIRPWPGRPNSGWRLSRARCCSR